MNRTYTLVIEPDDNDTLLITCPSIVGVVTFAETEADIDHWAADAIETRLWGLMRDDAALPPSDKSAPGRRQVRIALLSSLKFDLYEACRLAGVSRAELARRLGWHREQVDRLFRLNHASRLDQLEAAFRAVGCVVDLTVRSAA